MKKEFLVNNKMNYRVQIGEKVFILTRSELFLRIFDEVLGQTTKIQRAGESVWRSLNETAEWNLICGFEKDKKIWTLLLPVGRKLACFQNYLPVKKKQPVPEFSNQIIKQKKYVFKQKGPYSTKQISFFLKMGICSDRDFIWREPFKKWKKISLVSEFSTNPAQTIKDILTQQHRKYISKRVKMIRYSPSQPALDWLELQKTVQNFQKESVYEKEARESE